MCLAKRPGAENVSGSWTLTAQAFTKDTDGTTMPHDLGFPAPREKKQAEFVGKRSLFTDTANALIVQSLLRGAMA